MSRRSRPQAVLFALVSIGALGAACSSDSSGPGGPQVGSADSLATATDSIWVKFGIDDPKPPQTIYRDKAAPYPDAAGCKAFTSAYPATHDCTCDACFDLQQQCDALPGCIEIAECGISIGCKDAYTCYLTPADPKCVPIIDKWGNTGLAAALSLKLGECRTTAACP